MIADLTLFLVGVALAVDSAALYVYAVKASRAATPGGWLASDAMAEYVVLASLSGFIIGAALIIREAINLL
jgi:hypothetical protein